MTDLISATDELNRAYAHYLAAEQDVMGAIARDADARDRLNKARQRVAALMDAIWPPIRGRCD